MRSPVLQILLIGLTVALPICEAADEHEKFQRILFLSSYNSSFPTAVNQLEGVFALRRIHSHVEVDVEFMDTKRYPPEDRFPVIFDDLEGKIATFGNYDLVISSDDNALLFLLEFKNTLIGREVPVVFFGVNNHELAEQVGARPDYTGVMESPSLRETVDIAFEILPELDKLHVIVDATPSGNSDLLTFKETISSEMRDKVRYLNLGKMTFDQLAATLERLGKDSALLLLSAFTDKTGRRMEFYESLEFLSAHTDRPIFHPYRHGVGDGSIGGKVVSHRAMADMAVDMAAQILDGANPADIHLACDSGNLYMFDYRELDRLGIPLSKIPEESILLNKPETFFARNRNLIIAVLGGLSILLLSSLLFNIMFLRQRRILAELEESEERIRSLFENSFVPMTIIQPDDGKILDANPAALKFYGYTRSQFIRKTIWDVNTESSGELRKRVSSILDGTQTEFQSVHKLADGATREVSVITSCVFQKKKPLLFSIIQDTTERRNWEKQLIEARDVAEKANRTKDEFLATMSHELRTPLNPIFGYISVMKVSVQDPELMEFLAAMERSANRMLSLIEDLLNFSKLQEGIVTQRLHDFKLWNFLSELFEAYENQSGGNELRLINGDGKGTSVPESLKVHSDENMLFQILSNLVENACKYTDEGIVSIHCSMGDQIGDGVRKFKFEIVDNGIGISEEYQEQLFEPFSQEDSSYTRKFGGAGLGLAICRKLVDFMNGEIKCQSKLGEGSRFSLSIPMQIVENHDLADNS